MKNKYCVIRWNTINLRSTKINSFSVFDLIKIELNKLYFCLLSGGLDEHFLTAPESFLFFMFECNRCEDPMLLCSLSIRSLSTVFFYYLLQKFVWTEVPTKSNACVRINPLLRSDRRCYRLSSICIHIRRNHSTENTSDMMKTMRDQQQ